jgi:hypothetical protein
MIKIERTATTRPRRRFTLTGEAMHAVALDRAPMGPGFKKALLAQADCLEVAGNYEGRTFFKLRGKAGEVLAQTDFAVEDFVAGR